MLWVLAILCVCVAFWVNDRDRTQRAIVWWQKRQNERLHQTTELIREQMLQDLFALRRSLGVAIESPTLEVPLEPTLILADRCHRDLVDLSDRLCSPYAIENLEAALHEVVGRWKASYGSSTFSYIAEGTLEADESENYQFLLLWLDELCHVIIQPSQPIEMSLRSHPENDRIYLDCRIQAQSSELVLSEELQFLKRIFAMVHRGRCQITVQPDQCCIQLQW